MQRHIFVMFLLAGLAGAFAACSESQASLPTQPSGPAPSAFGESARFPTLTLNGPQSMAPGESAQFSAVAQFADGSTRDITREVSWSSSDSAVLSVAPGGLATASTVGETSVQYRFQGLDSGRKPVLILTPGTFLLSGRILDDGAPVFEARVEVAPGIGAGMSVQTDWNGVYRLIGVTPEAAIRVTKDEFQSATQSAGASTGTETRRSLNFNLARARPRPDYSGTYTLDVAATCQATSTVPDSLRRRRYTATLTQDATARVQLRLSGADFEVKYFPHGIGEGNLIHGQASDEHVRLVIDDVWDWGVNPNLIERLGNDTHLIIAGTVLLRQSPQGLSGTLDGYFRVTQNAYAAFSTAEACTGSDHAFVLSR